MTIDGRPARSTPDGLPARSPLDGVELPEGVAEIPFLAQFDLRADPGDWALMARLAAVIGVAPPTEPNTAVSTPDGAHHVLWLGPDEWLVIGVPGSAPGATPGSAPGSAPGPAPGPAPSLEAALAAAFDGAPGAVVDVSANRTMLSLVGPHARATLEHGCSIDLHPRAFGTGRCAQTMLARAAVILVRMAGNPTQVGPDPTPEYRILVRPSFANYLVAWLADALSEASTTEPPDAYR